MTKTCKITQKTTTLTILFYHNMVIYTSKDIRIYVNVKYIAIAFF